MSSSIPANVFNALVETLGGVDAIEICQGGLSPCNVWRIESGDSLWALKHFPKDHYSIERLSDILDYQNFLASLPLSSTFVPHLHQWKSKSRNSFASIFLQPEGYWVAMEWKTGKPLSFANMTPNQLDAVLNFLDEGYCSLPSKWKCVEVPSGVKERIAGLETWRHRIQGLDVGVMRADPMFAYMLDHFHRRAALLSKQISAQARPRECGWVMRDVRRDNLLFGESNASDANQRSLTGVIDFASVRMDWPWFDWVRVLTTNLPTNDVDSWHAAHDSFRRRTNFSLSWSDFADLAEASLLLSGMYWLGKQLAGDPLSPDGITRLQEIVGQLQGISWRKEDGPREGFWLPR